jgi:lipopolysaccharide export LptBFGC system permease protein LptF
MATHSVRQRTLGFNLGSSWPAFLAGALFLGLLFGGGVLIEPEENPMEFAMYLLVLAAGFAALGFARGQATQS